VCSSPALVEEPSREPAATPAPGSTPDADATLTLNGNNPVDWQEASPWQDNLGALFTHDGQSETIYSTSTVDVSTAGTTTLDYWAQIPGANFLHATRDVVVNVPANDNVATTTAQAANDNLPPLDATGTEATSSAQ
jgi:hypothetical protein